MATRLPALLLALSLLTAATVAIAAVQPVTASKKKASNPADAQRDILIRLERVPCMGSCPAYTVTILGDRSATFVAYDPKSTSHACCNLVKKKVLSPGDYNKLVNQIEAMKFFKLKAIYGPPPPDAGFETITVIDAPVEYNRVLYPGFLCRASDRKPVAKTDTNMPPDSLCKLDGMIDKITGARANAYHHKVQPFVPRHTQPTTRGFPPMSPSRALPRLLTIAIAASLTLSAGAFAADAKPMSNHAEAAMSFTASNPFYASSKLQYQTPAFDKIKDSDYTPALDEGMRQQRSEMNAIANNPQPATFDNTIVAMERSGQLLTRVSKVFFNLSQSNTNDAIQKIEEDMAPKLSQHQDAITLDPKLFVRVKAVYDQRATLKLDPESDRLVQKYYDMFVRSGAQLNDADKTKIKALNERLATLSTEFGKNVLASTASGAVVVDNKADLDGMSDEDIAAAAEAAKGRKLDGKWLLTLQNHTTQPQLASLKNRALREKLFKASLSRSDTDGANDNRALISEMAQLRAQRAKLLGYPTYADYTLEDQMAKTPTAANDLMQRVAAAAVVNAKAEAAKIQVLINTQAAAKHAMGFKLQPWDWDFYAEQVRKAEYDLDETQIKPYFELDRVLKDGVFFAAHQMYGLSFKERKDLPVYQPDVRVFEVFDEHGKSIALFYFDYFARDSKHGGAWMDTFVDQSDLLHQRPVIVNVGNFTKPAPGQPALISFDDVTTMFHEFGHGLHGLSSNVKYPLFSGANTPRDFVEFPSQFNENWALEPTVFANYAKHYKTGAPMPAELVAKIKKSGTFNQGYETTEYVAAALLDMAWHALPADAPRQDADAFEADALKKFGVAVDEVPPRYRSTYFQHIWSGGYAAGYYAYLWTAVLAQDAFAWFNEHGGMTRANGEHYRATVLSRGGTKDAHQLYLDFRGKEPSVEPYLEKKGLNAAPAKQ